jgi:hypothetical protein
VIEHLPHHDHAAWHPLPPSTKNARGAPPFRAGRKGRGPAGATAEPSGGVEAPAGSVLEVEMTAQARASYLC